MHCSAGTAAEASKSMDDTVAEPLSTIHPAAGGAARLENAGDAPVAIEHANSSGAAVPRKGNVS
jgi:hypothetical protein